MQRALLATCLILGFLFPTTASSQTTPTKGKPMPKKAAAEIDSDYVEHVVSLSGKDSPLATGNKVIVRLTTGKTLDEMQVASVSLGNDGTLKSFTLTDDTGKKKVPVTVATLQSVSEGRKLYEPILDPSKKGTVLYSVTDRDKAVDERLRSRGSRLWPELSDDEQAEHVEKYKTFLKEEVADKASTPMQLHETKFFLFLTDIPTNQVAPYINYLDAMYAELCKMFGVPRDKNVFQGKCLVIAFLQKQAFINFEAVVMKNPNAEGAAGLHHSSSNGRALISVHRGNDPTFFANVLVHETSHGFVFRLRSGRAVPSWLNEGIADTVAQVIVKSNSETQKRQRKALDEARQRGNVGTLFSQTSKIEGFQYGISSSLVQFMLQLDTPRFRQLVLSTKEGFEFNDALQRSYGVTDEELLALYSRSVGLPGLKVLRDE